MEIKNIVIVKIKKCHCEPLAKGVAICIIASKEACKIFINNFKK